MDILIPDSWLKKFLTTKAKPNEIEKYLSLCGPSVERINKTPDGDSVYSIEITTNRTDSAGVLGIAREAQTILPRFGIAAKLKNKESDNSKKFKFVKSVKYLEATVDPKLCPRFTVALIKNVTIKDSPKEVCSLLEKVGVRPINNIVDVSNYIMHELGQPVHTFDYDKIGGKKMILRAAKIGEKVTTLDGKTFELGGSDITIEDREGRLIDLCGIMGGENSAVDKNTKNVLLFIQNYEQYHVRQTSMKLAQRSEAAALFEKGIDSEGVAPAMLSAIEMIEESSGGVSEKEILDIYPAPYKEKFVSISLELMERIIGVKIARKDITNYLTSLGFSVTWNGDALKAGVPSFRASDINIPEDIAEEVARIYGYHNLPNVLMEGPLPKPKTNKSYKVENTIRQTLKGLGAVEVYNLSLTNKDDAGEDALRLINPLGTDTEYLRTSLRPSLIKNIDDNPQEEGKIHLFEIANIYLPRRNDLPEERLILGGIIKNGDFRKNKSLVFAILSELDIDFTSKVEEGNGYLPGQRISIFSHNQKIGEYGNLLNGYFYYEFDVQILVDIEKVIKKYKEPSKYPAQIEDITLILPAKTRVGDILDYIPPIHRWINDVKLVNVYKNAYTFRIWYHDEEKTLTDVEVGKVRTEIVKSLKSKFGVNIKE